MFEDYYMTADDVAKALKISKSFAYKVNERRTARTRIFHNGGKGQQTILFGQDLL